MRHVTTGLGRAGLLVALVAALAGGALAAGGELVDGEVLSAANWEKAEGLLPPEILNHYRRGEYMNAYFDLSKPGVRSLRQPEAFQKDSAANRGRYRLTPEGSIVTADGKNPGLIVGFPFPDIDPKDPRAGAKIVWNYFYNFWYSGNGHFYNQLVWVGRKGVDRKITTDTYFLRYQGTTDALAYPNPNDLYLQSKSVVVEPADLQGTASLTWRFRDPKRRDQDWTYVPVLRRVRAVSPSNRSDGFLGSDLSQDDGEYFDGKPEDFTWKLVGETEQLVLVDKGSVTGETRIKALPGGGARILWSKEPWVGYEKPGWKGVPWAPVPQVLVRRKFWVVEGTPHDRYYLYGKLRLRFDKETFKGFWSSKYDWNGELLTSYQKDAGAYYSVDGKNWFNAGPVAYQTAENLRLDRATVVTFTRSPDDPADYHVPLTPEEFSYEWLLRVGK